MTPEATISLSLVFGLVASIAAIIGVVLNLSKHKDSKVKEENETRLSMAEQFACINVKLDTVTNSIAELNKKNDTSIGEIQRINQTNAIMSERIDHMMKNQEEFEKRLNDLETRWS